MHTRLVTFVIRLILACAILLALPGPAMGAMSISGPATVSEAAGKATYTVQCGDTGAGLPGLPGLPGGLPGLPGGLPDLPGLPGLPRVVAQAAAANTGLLNITLTDGPAPATQPADHGAASQTSFTCSPAATSFTVDVPIVNDVLDEQNEKLTIAAGGVLVPEGSVSQSLVTTIVDDDPVAKIAPVTFVVEEDSGTTAVEVAVTLASAAATATTIAFETDDLTATAGRDYTAMSGNVVFQPGQMKRTIALSVLGDTDPEGAEAFFVNLKSTNNGSLLSTANKGGVGIFDNDSSGLPKVSLPRRVTVDEGDARTGKALFNVRLSTPAIARTEVKWKTANFTAKRADYEAASGNVIFKKGQRAKTVSVDVKGDKRDEPDEAFAVTLRDPVAAVLGDKGAFGIIEDDDGPKMKIGKPRIRGKRLVTQLTCPESASLCKGRLAGTAGDLNLGRKKFKLAKGDSTKLKLKMSKAARQELGEQALRAILAATVADDSGDTRVVTRKARLKG